MTDDATELELEVFRENLAKDIYEICQNIYKLLPKLTLVMVKLRKWEGGNVMEEVQDTASGLKRELDRMSALYFELKDKK